MKNNFGNSNNVKINLRLFMHLVGYSVLIGITTQITAYFNIKSLIAPASAQLISQSNPAKRLVGKWETKDPESGQIVRFIFTADNKFYMLRQPYNGDPEAEEYIYQIKSNNQPMQLELIVSSSKQSMKGTFEFTEQGELRLDFSDNNYKLTILSLKKVSNVTSLPPKTIIIDPKYTAKQSDAKTYIASMIRAQQAYYTEMNKFAKTIKELVAGIPSSTKDYNYQVLPQGNKTQKVMMTATAKDPKLKSYTGAVFIVKIKGKNEMIIGICETNKPSLLSPVMPTISSSKIIQCPVDSKLLSSRAK